MNFFNQVLVTAIVILLTLNVEALSLNAGQKSLYVLNLKRGFKYVGSTTNIDQRLKQHQDGKATKWTSLHETINLSETRQLPPSMSNEEARLQEDYLVKKLMLAHGIEKVRGGCYSSVTLPDCQIKALRQILNHAKDRCYNCGETGHFAADCPNVDNAPMKKYAQSSNMRKQAEKPDEPDRDLDVLLEEDGAKKVREEILTENSDLATNDELNDKLRALEEETKLKDKKIEELNETVKLGESERSGLDENLKESEKVRSLLDRRLQDIEARLRGQTRSCNTIESTLRQSEESKRSLSDRLQLSETKLQESKKVIRELRSTNEILLSSLAKEQARVDKLQGGVMANSGLANEISDLKEQIELFSTTAKPRRRKRFGLFRPIWRRK
ncbi:hypothetical protein TrVE_jg11593 [Triparma verrucosa]|uniref:CCHC-type domain-containing protein n=1 Tax=Triparma verrucosa TaxID=1606542 RepID=A0A9W7BBA9_9STRA|nr:hypothetical protein TrVE_jg11593 [Triparma verrucosa]